MSNSSSGGSDYSPRGLSEYLDKQHNYNKTKEPQDQDLSKANNLWYERIIAKWLGGKWGIDY
jgi:hypothetical protein